MQLITISLHFSSRQVNYSLRKNNNESCRFQKQSKSSVQRRKAFFQLEEKDD